MTLQGTNPEMMRAPTTGLGRVREEAEKSFPSVENAFWVPGLAK